MVIFDRWLGLALLILILVQNLQAIRWLAIRVDSEQDWNMTHCRAYKRRAFLGKQFRICYRNMPIMKYVSEAVENTLDECQKQLHNRRWNCSTILRAPKYLSDLTGGTKESAYVYALSAAAITYTVAEACSTGKLKTCACGRTPKLKLAEKNWQWGGCNDNVAYGYRFSKQFTDSQEFVRYRSPRGHAKALMNMHNNEAGRRAVRDKMDILCRCHGVSGSCTTKTCFRRLSYFEIVAAHLRKKYDRAIRVIQRRKGERVTLVSKKKKNYSPRDLIALQKSPNFCLRNRKNGSLGTRGRRCSRKGRGQGSCNYMCCGRGNKQFKEIKVERCKCRYEWCCTVICSKCSSQVDVNTCR